MKRKFKFMSTIASLSLAVALLVFGVVAAVTRSVTITGEVTFTSARMDVDVEIFVANAATANTSSHKALDANLMDAGASLNLNEVEDISLDFTDKVDGVTEIAYLVHFKNNYSADTIAVTFTKPTVASPFTLASASGTEVPGTPSGDTASSTATIAANGDLYYLIVITVDPGAAEISDTQDIGSLFTLVRGGE